MSILFLHFRMDSNKSKTDKKSDPLNAQFTGNPEELIAEKLAKKDEENSNFTFREIMCSVVTAAAFFAVALVIAVVLPIVV